MKKVIQIITILSFLFSCSQKKVIEKKQKVITLWETYNK